MDRPRIKPSRASVWTSRAVVTLGAVVLCVAPVLAVGVWRVIADPVVAADVVAEGDMWPIVWAIVETVGDAYRELLTML